MEEQSASTEHTSLSQPSESSLELGAREPPASIACRTAMGAMIVLGVGAVLWADSLPLERLLPPAAEGLTGLHALVQDGLLMALVVAVVAGMALNDYCSLSRRLGAEFSRLLFVAGGVVLLALQWAGWAYLYGHFTVCPAWLRQPGTTVAVGLCGAAFILMADRVLRARVEGSISSASLFVLGLLHVAVPFGFLGAMRARWDVPAVLTAVAVCKSTDIGAYYAGKLIGGPPLAPRLSPRKTWAGAIGGALAAVLTALALSAAGWSSILSPTQAALYGLLLAPVAMLGDLSESLLKRQAGVKDSGNLPHGYGGMLDMTDDLLFALPFSYLFFTAVYHCA